MSQKSSAPKSLGSYITDLLTYGVGAVMGGSILFIVGAFIEGSFVALRAKPPAPAAEAAPPAATPPPAPAAPSPAPASPAAAGGTDLLATGQRIYSTVCIACHQPTGQGLPPMFPPLAGSDWVNVKKPDRMIRMVLHGFTGLFTLNGQPFTSPAPLMPPQGGALNDEQIAGVLTYVRSNFGNKAGAVTPAEVAAIREAEKARSAMWTEAEILKIPTE
ncbi:c-type cytochrome [Prosthecobacter sp.]|jgi:nitrite reductase (NO-forming)|uniref:c-type cytochrome n=1 Tax=Prosthecobacter sp. TaxID=1965333 RepID=UPI0037C61369